jgi:ribonucleoside-diphosphate reductase alpha chain
MVAPAERRRLANRRPNETFSFSWRGMAFTATISRFPDGRLGEIFLTNGKVNTDADTAARDSAVVASLALQHGVPLDTLRKALLRDPRGVASGPLGTGLDLIAKLDGERS